MAPTKLEVGTADPKSSGLPKGLLPARHTIEQEQQGIEVNQAAPTAVIPSSLLKKAPGEGTGPTIHADFRGNFVGRVPSRGEHDVFQQAARGGTLKNLVLLCMFNNHTAGVHTRPQSDYDVLFNRIGGDPILAPTGSVRDFYKEISYGTMTIESTMMGARSLGSLDPSSAGCRGPGISDTAPIQDSNAFSNHLVGGQKQSDEKTQLKPDLAMQPTAG